MQDERGLCKACGGGCHDVTSCPSAAAGGSSVMRKVLSSPIFLGDEEGADGDDDFGDEGDMQDQFDAAYGRPLPAAAQRGGPGVSDLPSEGEAGAAGSRVERRKGARPFVAGCGRPGARAASSKPDNK